MSYTVADPIYYQKPVFRFRRPMGTKKNLFDNFEEDPSSPSEDAIKVFLRLKPSSVESNVIEVLDSKTLLFKMPQEFMQARNKLNMPDQHKYSFSHIFKPETTQSQIYTGCVAPLVKDLFNGQHCLLFTYGTTNAGKTFTVLGNGDNPGIIPRTLATVFKSISGKEYKNEQIRPDNFNSAIEVTETTLAEERKFKETILTWKSSQVDSKLYKTSSTIRSSVDEIFGESVFKEMQKRLTNDTSIVEYTSDSEDRFSVWISFAEIYNEAIYDLLQPVILNSKRKQLKLGQDSHKNYYIKGLKHIFVQSEEEAYKVLMFGKTNLQVAATGMNSRSSRSHCIFTIKLIKSPNVEHPERVVVSSFSICDLAGAERQKKTLNVGLRLKESQNINCSLHVLSRCFTIIRENQMSIEPKMIPFRDSKLTQLFKHALTGKESVTMIVNVNSDYQLCEETQHVLKASAIAKHIVVQPRKTKVPARETRQSMFSQIVKHNRSTLIPWDSCVKNKAQEIVDEVPTVDEPCQNDREQKQEQYENLLSLVEDLKEKLKEEKSKHNETKKKWIVKEEEIRKEMEDEMAEFVKQAKQEPMLDQKITDETVEDIKPKKRKLLSPEEKNQENKKKTDHCQETGPRESFNLKDLEEEVKMQQKQIDGLTDLVNILREEKKELGMELSLARLNLHHREREIGSLKAKIEMFGEESAMHEKYLALEKEMENKLRIRDDLLNEAKEDLLEELRAKDDLEEEIAKLEKELTEKEEEMLSKIEELKEQITDRDDQIDFLEARIEHIEMIHKNEVESLKSKIVKLEETELRYTEGKNESIEDLQSQISVLTKEKEELLCEKLSLEEQLTAQAEDYNSYKEETTEKINSIAKLHEEEMTKIVNDFEIKIKSREDEINKLNEELTVQIENLNSIKGELQSKVKEVESLKSDLERKENEHDSLRTKLENEIADLTHRIEEGDRLSSICNELKSKCQSLQDDLIRKSEEIDALQKTVESLSSDKSKIEEEYRSEISTLEQINVGTAQRGLSDNVIYRSTLNTGYKEQLKETTRLWDSQRADGLEKEKLSKELSKVKNVLADLNKSLKEKEHELKCCQNKMMGYEKLVPTLEAEFNVHRRELAEYKKRCEDQKETIINMEKELTSFQINQKEIIGKYEDNLKKTKDENEALKKEVARVTSTFYKSTPTPKKVLEKQLDEQRKEIEDLKKQLEDKEVQCEKLQKDNKTLSSQLEVRTTQEANKENDCVSGLLAKAQKARTKSTKQAVEFETRRKGANGEEDPDSGSDVAKNVRSTSKTRRMTRAAAAVPAIVVSCAEASQPSENKPPEGKKVSRKKLWDDTYNDGKEFEDDDQLNIPEDSPGTSYRRTLRNRNK